VLAEFLNTHRRDLIPSGGLAGVITMRKSIVVSILVTGFICCLLATYQLTPRVAAEVQAQSQSPAATIQSFTAVEGADLKSRLDAAASRARGGTPYWSAYAFDVRPGVAIDPDIHQFNGSINTYGETRVFTGTTGNGVTVETRNVAVFVLRDPGNNQVTRIELYNLERKREYSGYPVYWLGRANNEESLNYLRGFVDSNPANLLSERATLAISVHDDARVAGILKGLVQNSTNLRVRSSAIYWLGQVGGEEAFLASLVRNTAEDIKIRQRAAYSIGDSHSRTSLALVQNLYDTVTERDLRRSLVRAVGNSDDKDGALVFLLKVARTDEDREAQRTAIRQLGEFDRESVVDDLTKLYNDNADLEAKRSALRAMGQMKNQRAQSRLVEIARNDPSFELRRQAVSSLGQRGEGAVDDLLRLYDSETRREVRGSILRSLNQIKSTRVEDKLLEVARADNDLELRREAIRALGERVSQRTLKFLTDTAEAVDGNTDVQLSAVRAISQRPKDESVPVLIRIARTHPNPAVRRQAIRSLGDSGDPRAVEFFREVLTK
jgi:HEAT repeat protein